MALHDYTGPHLHLNLTSFPLRNPPPQWPHWPSVAPSGGLLPHPLLQMLSLPSTFFTFIWFTPTQPSDPNLKDFPKKVQKIGGPLSYVLTVFVHFLSNT